MYLKVCRLDNQLNDISTTETKSSLVKKVPFKHFRSSAYERHVIGPQSRTYLTKLKKR